MVAAFVQAWTGASASANNVTTGTATSTAGNQLFVAVTCDTATAPVITDNKSNTSWQQAKAPANNGSDYTSLYYHENIAGGAGHTITATVAGGAFLAIGAMEYSGLALTGSLDKTATAGTGNSSSLVSGSTAAIAQSDEVVIGCGNLSGGTNSTFTGTGGATVRSQVGTTTTSATVYLSDEVVSAIAVQNATCTWGSSAGPWIAHCATFKAAGGGGTTPVTKTVSTTWNTLAPVTAARSTTWVTRAAVTATRATTWNVLSQVTTTRATTWNVLSQVTTTRATTWNVLSKVTTTRATTWNTRAALTTTRSTTWNVLSSLVSVTKTVSTTWNTRAAVVTTRTTTWNVNALAPPGTIFRPPVVFEGNHGKEPLWRNVRTTGRGVNVFALADGSYTEHEPPGDANVVKTYLGGHDNPVTPAEVASLVAAGYGANIS